MSRITSLAIHLIVVPLMLWFAWFLIKPGLGEDDRPVDKGQPPSSGQKPANDSETVPLPLDPM